MTTLARPAAVPLTVDPEFSFLWLEITGRCGLACAHCYAQSGPSGRHGAMTGDDWRSVITQAADLGISMVQFIGGEPTLHPDFAGLLACAVDAGLAAEVYTNLTRVKDSWWDLLACPNVSLATSYYSDDPAQHDAITGRLGSHARTLASIRQATARGIPLRAGIIEVMEGQRTNQARAELEAIGVTRIRTDRLRRLGRAATSSTTAWPHDISELCGNCGQGIAAILPSGDVTPCVMARWLSAGNVREAPLDGILAGPAMAAAVVGIPSRPAVAARSRCGPERCGPVSGDSCPPSGQAQVGQDCAPVTGGGCNPSLDQCGPNKATPGRSR